MGGHGLEPDELARTLEHAFGELSGPPAAVTLLHRTGNWLSALDAAGFIEIGPPHPDDPDARPRATIAWTEALAAAEHGGALASRSLDLHLDDDPYAVEPDPDQPRRDVPVLRLAAGLAGAVAVDLRSDLSGLDRPTTAVLLAAISAATQAHVQQFRAVREDGRPSSRGSMRWVGPLYDWSDAEAEVQRWTGSNDPSGPWRQGRLSLYPAADAEADLLRAALTNPYPVAELPLGDHLRRVLEALRPQSVGRRSRRRARLADDVDDSVLRYTRGEVEDWLGFPLPSLTPLEASGFELICRTAKHFWNGDADPLPARGSLLPNGEPLEVSIQLLWVPRGPDAARVAPDEERVTGLVRWSPFVRLAEDPSQRTTSFTEPAGGYTRVTVNSTRIGVQHGYPGHTRIGWSRDVLGEQYNLALHLPWEPVRALELVLASRNAPTS
ncbi:hypothetical protein OG218_02590 [Kineococcus sp. NBC_00420]|uniref:hypothetical protein n=1 Tax=Kineococcus sp. NBC_00420 TaxID=2903564 RepID=UPI002E22F106